MHANLTAILVIVLLSVLLSLGSSRMMALIKIMVLQGALVSLVPLFMESGVRLSNGGIFFFQVMFLIKAVLIPGLLYLALTRIAIKREVEPLIGYHASLAVGVVLVLVVFFRLNGTFSLAGYFTGPQPISIVGPQGALLLLVIVSLFMILLAENSRVPVDDPATHLELTMIHEVMILDHSGPDLALIELGAFYKLLFYAACVANLLKPFTATSPLTDILVFYGLIALIYLVIGLIESLTARLKMPLVPKYLLTSAALAFLAVVLTMEIV